MNCLICMEVRKNDYLHSVIIIQTREAGQHISDSQRKILKGLHGIRQLCRGYLTDYSMADEFIFGDENELRVYLKQGSSEMTYGLILTDGVK